MPVTVSPDARRTANPDAFRGALRRLAASVSIVTSRDGSGDPHGMVASSVIPVSMDPPSMLVAVNRDAGLHPVLLQSRRFCVNLLADDQHHLLATFSQTALRDERFASEDWCDVRSDGVEQLPWLPGAAAAIDCVVDMTIDYGTHTLFVGRVIGVRCSDQSAHAVSPLVWLAGRRAAIALAA